MDDSFGIGDVMSELLVNYRERFGDEKVAAAMTAFAMDMLCVEIDRQCCLLALSRSNDPVYNAWLHAHKWC